jgi:radical SAM superfamily enzyme YgiQ (UPF0313 family)
MTNEKVGCLLPCSMAERSVKLFYISGMNILMLYPKAPFSYNNPEHYLPKFRNRSSYPMAPLGLLTIASYLPKDFNIRLYNRIIEEESEEDWEWADVVFFSLMLAQIDDYQLCVKKAKERGKPIAVGGPFTHAAPEMAVQDADWVCFGEGEDIMEALIKDIRKDARGKVYQGGNKTDMENVKVPRFDLLRDMNTYSVMPVQFSRGCPFSCEFCDIIEIYGQVPRAKKPAQIFEELDLLKKLKFRGFVALIDDNFIGNKRKAKEMALALAEWNRRNGYPYLFGAQASLNLADDDSLLEAMAAANFVVVFIGIETPDPKLLRVTKKFQNIPGNILEKLDRIRSYGIHLNAGFIVGFDGEDCRIFETQRQIIQASGIGQISLSLLGAIPHTDLWRRLKGEGRLLENLHLKMGYSEGINFIPKGEITKRRYLEGYAGLISDIYQPEAYFTRIQHASLALRHKVNLFFALRMTVRLSLKLFRDLFYVAFTAKPFRLHFWRAFLNVLRKNPSALLTFLFDSYWFPYLNHAAIGLQKDVIAYLENPEPFDILDETYQEPKPDSAVSA